MRVAIRVAISIATPLSVSHVFCTAALCFSMALTGQTGRLVADPTIGVEDMTVVFENWLQSRGTRDFFKELNMPRGLTCKKAPIGTWLAGVADLYKEIMTLAPNGMLSTKKVRTALGKMNDSDKVNHTRKTDPEQCSGASRCKPRANSGASS